MVFLLQTSCAPTKEGAGRDEASSSPPPYPSAASLTASDAGPIRAIAVVAATSMVTLPTVRTRSGIISTAISRASGSIGIPIATQLGANEVRKITCQGRLPDTIVAITATAAPAALGGGARDMHNR